MINDLQILFNEDLKKLNIYLELPTFTLKLYWVVLDNYEKTFVSYPI